MRCLTKLCLQTPQTLLLPSLPAHLHCQHLVGAAQQKVAGKRMRGKEQEADKGGILFAHSSGTSEGRTAAPGHTQSRDIEETVL